MTPEELAKIFLENPEAMQQYRKVISILRGLGFETMVRRLGEPSDRIPLDHVRHIEMSAVDQIEKRGFQQALDLVFDFDEVIASVTNAQAEISDYGAGDIMKGLGYKTEEIE